MTTQPEPTAPELALTRECAAVVIPQGTPTTLAKGTRVTITQSLGGNYTVACEGGVLARIAAADADALGFEKPPASPETPVSSAEIDEAAVWDALRNCYDPEIPVNIVDLGLVYDCSIARQEGQEAGVQVLVKMTLTAPGCGMGPAIAGEARSRILSLPGVTSAEVELVWDPAWNQSMISEAGKMQLGWL